MAKIIRAFTIILLGLLYYSCTSEDPLIEENIINPENLLKSVISGHTTKFYEYNSDYTLNSIKKERNGVLESESKFIYSNEKVSEIIWKNILDNFEVKKVFEYNGDLLIKETFFKKNEIIAIHEYYYDNNNQMNKQIQKLEWNDENNKKTRIIDLYKVPNKNVIQIKYNDVLTFITIYDDKIAPNAKIKGYSIIYAVQFYGITNNILNFKRVNSNGEEITETHELTFDSSGKHLLKDTKKENNQTLIGKDIYTYN